MEFRMQLQECSINSFQSPKYR